MNDEDFVQRVYQKMAEAMPLHRRLLDYFEDPSGQNRMYDK